MVTPTYNKLFYSLESSEESKYESEIEIDMPCENEETSQLPAVVNKNEYAFELAKRDILENKKKNFIGITVLGFSSILTVTGPTISALAFTSLHIENFGISPLSCGFVAGGGLITAAVSALIGLQQLDHFRRIYKDARLKAEYSLKVNPERIQYKKICLILEAVQKLEAFPSISPYQEIESRYPHAFAEISSGEDILKVATQVQALSATIKILVIRAHGSQHAMRLDKNELIDIKSKPIFKLLSKQLKPNGHIILDSCQTASTKDKKNPNIAEQISRWCPSQKIHASTRNLTEDHVILKVVKPLKIELLSQDGTDACVVYQNGRLQPPQTSF